MNPLTLEEIDDARKKILQNASELIEEAQLLLEHKRHARAYALAHIGCEELAKLPMLARVAPRVAQGLRVDWKKLGKRLFSHAAKTRNWLGLDVARNSIDKEPFDEELFDKERFVESVSLAPVLVRLRNQSLYTDEVDGTYQTPSEVVPERMAEIFVGLARERLDFVRPIEESLHGRWHEIGSHKDFRELLKRIGLPSEWAEL